MSIEKNVQIVKDFFAAMGSGDKQDLLALSAEDIEWIIPAEDWPLAGTHRGHAGMENLLQKANETVATSFPEDCTRNTHTVWWRRYACLPLDSRSVSGSVATSASHDPYAHPRATRF